jgi:DNA mismatch repair protein MutS
MSFFPQGSVHGIAVADVSTGDFIVYESQKPLEDEISIYAPREILVPESLIDDIHYSTIFEGHYISKVGDEIFDPSEAYKTLLRHFGVTSLEGYGLGAYGAPIQAAGALISYLEQVDSSLQFRKIAVKREREFMFIDSSTQRNLELLRNLKDGSSEATLLWALDETFTPMGGRFLRNAIVMPLLDIDAIRNRQSAVGRLFEDYELIEVLRRNLRKIQDIERIERRISLGSANARDLIALKNSLSVLPEIQKALLASKNELLISLGNKISDFGSIVSEIERAIAEHPPLGLRDGGIIKDGYSSEIDELREISKNGKSFIASMEAEERKKTGISSLKIGYNKIFGYYIEVTKPNLELVPERYIRKQTLVGAERFITPELKEYETKVLGAEERLRALEFEVFKGVLSNVASFSDKLLATSQAVAEVDFLHSLAIVAKRHDYTCPKVNDSLEIKIIEGGK